MSELIVNKKYSFQQWKATNGTLQVRNPPSYGIIQSGTVYASGRLLNISYFRSDNQVISWRSGTTFPLFQNFSGYLGYAINTNLSSGDSFALYNSDLPTLDVQRINNQFSIVEYLGPTINIASNFSGKITAAYRVATNGISLQSYTAGATFNFFNTFSSGTTYLIRSAPGSLPYNFYNNSQNQNLPIQQPDAAYVNQSYTYQLQSEG